MKKITFYTIAALFMFGFLTTEVKANSKTPLVSSITATTSSAEANTYLARLDEIYNMEKSTLSPPQKRTLRNEVKSIQKRLQTLDGGIYLSAGAIIIILLIIILIF